MRAVVLDGDERDAGWDAEDEYDWDRCQMAGCPGRGRPLPARAPEGSGRSRSG
ncbi:hypothetical protein [Streptomyces sp. NPDC047315]|uniref:hypothetical protein n=1 Tax=Streptomyces sp. NPDC047315 TaxID=3155142 RepID=UPI0033F6F20C